jgi:hypothetical protein
MSTKTGKHMTWHHSHDAVDEVMVHLLMVKLWNILIGCFLSF